MKTISCDLCESLLNVIEDFRAGEDICTDCLQKMYAVASHALTQEELLWLHTKGLHTMGATIFDRLVLAMDTYLLRGQIVDALKRGGYIARNIADQLHPDYRTAFMEEVTSQ